MTLGNEIGIEARRQDEASTVVVEVRSVNGRHLKLSTRIGEPFSVLEPEVEPLVLSAEPAPALAGQYV